MLNQFKYELNEGLKGEEILAMYVELMANPQIYYSTVGKGFWKNTKNQILNFLMQFRVKFLNLANFNLKKQVKKNLTLFMDLANLLLTKLLNFIEKNLN